MRSSPHLCDNVVDIAKQVAIRRTEQSGVGARCKNLISEVRLGDAHGEVIDELESAKFSDRVTFDHV